MNEPAMKFELYLLRETICIYLEYGADTRSVNYMGIFILIFMRTLGLFQSDHAIPLSASTGESSSCSVFFGVGGVS